MVEPYKRCMAWLTLEFEGVEISVLAEPAYIGLDVKEKRKGE